MKLQDLVVLSSNLHFQSLWPLFRNCPIINWRLYQICIKEGGSFYSAMPAPETETWTILRPSLFWPNTSCSRHFLSFPLHPRQIAPIDEYRPNLMVIICCIIPQLNQHQRKPFIPLSRRCHFNLWHFNCNAKEEYLFPNTLQPWICYSQVVRLIRIYLKLLAIQAELDNYVCHQDLK